MDQDCEICYKIISDSEPDYSCPSCNQDYHEGCVKILLQNENTCPMCKSSIIPEIHQIGEGRKLTRKEIENIIFNPTEQSPDVQALQTNSTSNEEPQDDNIWIGLSAVSQSLAAATIIIAIFGTLLTIPIYLSVNEQEGFIDELAITLFGFGITSTFFYGFHLIFMFTAKNRNSK